MIKEIVSVSNPVIKSTKELLTAKGRAQQRAFIAEGEHLCQEALAADWQPEALFVQKEAFERYSRIIERCQALNCEIYALSGPAFAAISETKTPQGVLMRLPMPDQRLNTVPEGKLAVALDAVQDPGNLGTILRTAVAVGADYVLASADCADFFSGKTVRASMGAIFHMKVYVTEDLPQTLLYHRNENWRCLCAHLKGTDFFSREAREKNLLVIGNEGRGVSDACADACSALYRIPMALKAESLNAAVACGIMLYDLWRSH